jgi:hypothetical protein
VGIFVNSYTFVGRKMIRNPQSIPQTTGIYKLLPQKKTHGFSHGMNFACTEDFS